MKDLDPAALACLAALADDGNFERAAQRLSITQSAVSQRLRTLETQVGQLLVVRSRPLRLTEPGKVLLRFARQLQAMRADVAHELGMDPGSGQRLAIAVNADSLATWVMPALDGLVRAGVSLELVVDDQDIPRNYVARALRDAGYDVAQARDGIEAIEQLHTACPDLLITDNRMPGMSGDALIAEARDRVPELAILRISGGGDGEHPRAPTLYKPFDPDALLAAVQELLPG